MEADYYGVPGVCCGLLLCFGVHTSVLYSSAGCWRPLKRERSPVQCLELKLYTRLHALDVWYSVSRSVL